MILIPAASSAILSLLSIFNLNPVFFELFILICCSIIQFEAIILHFTAAIEL